MRLTLCDCGVAYLVRLNRTVWMHLVPGRRHYFCVRCKSHQFLSRNNLRRAFPALPRVVNVDVTAPADLEPAATPSDLFASSTHAPERSPTSRR